MICCLIFTQCMPIKWIFSRDYAWIDTMLSSKEAVPSTSPLKLVLIVKYSFQWVVSELVLMMVVWNDAQVPLFLYLQLLNLACITYQYGYLNTFSFLQSRLNIYHHWNHTHTLTLKNDNVNSEYCLMKPFIIFLPLLFPFSHWRSSSIRTLPMPCRWGATPKEGQRMKMMISSSKKR